MPITNPHLYPHFRKQEIPIYAVAIIKNGVKFDYPFVESIRSIQPFIRGLVVNVGKSDDGTLEVIKKEFPWAHIVESDWGDHRTDGGKIFSDATNLALQTLRNLVKEDLQLSKDYSKAYIFHLQSDEVLHEGELDQIADNIKRAFQTGCDALTFRYVHFWQSHHQIAINKKWYPQEIRCLKMDAPIESWGDAQSFRGGKNIFQSDAHIYHYGHVRDPKKYQQKVDRMIAYYVDAKNYSRFMRKWKGKDAHTETIDFYGDHPQVMQDRLKRLGGHLKALQKPFVYIVADLDQHSMVSKWIPSIHARKVYLVEKIRKVPSSARKEHMVIFRPTFWQRIWFKIRVPVQMRSKFARPFDDQWRLLLYLSQKQVGMRKS